MPATRRSTLLAALLTSIAMITPSLAFADVTYEDVESIPNILSLFQSEPDSSASAEKKSTTKNANEVDEENTHGSESSSEHAEATKTSSDEDASR